LIVDDYYVARLNRDDHARDLQSLYDRCPDYVQLAFGEPARASAAEEDFAFQRNIVFGIYSRDAEMIGALELMRDYPKADEWWIGLLLLDPRARGAGLGERICRTTFDWIAGEGGRAVWLGVLKPNERAQKFWRNLGFVDVEWQPYVSANGHESMVLLMKR
jgi:ribosomal protein S18 acetylase RimI-like enzyme